MKEQLLKLVIYYDENKMEATHTLKTALDKEDTISFLKDFIAMLESDND